MRNAIIEKVESLYMRKDVPVFRVGDTVKVMQRVREGNKTRSQAFEGVVMRRQGEGLRKSFTVRRISFGEGVEKTFPVHSPTVQSVTLVQSGKVRRSKLYYLRTKSGKEGRIKSLLFAAQQAEQQEAIAQPQEA